jgi:hypothetical protein
MASTSSAARLALSYTGTGKLDALLTALPLLKRRINTIRQFKAKNGHPNPNPTPAELMKTHFLPVIDLFKPHVIAALEYHRQSPSSGGGDFGRETMYEIPLAGDLFSDCLLEVQFPEVRCAPVTFGAGGTPVSLIVLQKNPSLTAPGFSPTTLAGAGINSVFSLAVGAPTNIAYNTTSSAFKIMGVTADAGVLPNGLPYTAGTDYTLSRNYRLVNHADAIVMGADGTNPNGAASTELVNWVKMVDWPGLRMFDKVSFEVNGSPIDDYDYISAVRHMQHSVPPHKMAAFQALVGHQRSPQQSTSVQTTLAGQSVISTTGVSVAEQSFKQRTTVAGYQVPQLAIRAHIFHPLLFWFCLSKRSAIPGVCMPDGHKHIKAQLTQLNNIFVPASPDLFVEETAYFTPIANATAPHFKTERKFPVLVPGSDIQASLQSGSVDSYLHICNIFMDQDIHDIFISRVSFMLVRLHKYLSVQVPASTGQNRISNAIKFPVEFIQIGFTEAALLKNGVAGTSSAQNDGSAVSNHYRAGSYNKYDDYAHLWYRSGLNRLETVDDIVSSRCVFTDATGAPLAGPVGAVGTDDLYVGMFGASNLTEVANGGPLAAGSYVNFIKQIDSHYSVSNRPLISKIEILAQGATIWSGFAQQIYNRYMSYQYGADAYNGTDEESQFFITWALYPGMFQPSGFLNFSRLREIDLNFESKDGKHIGLGTEETLNNVTLHVLGSSLNFLLVADGNALIRYV